MSTPRVLLVGLALAACHDSAAPVSADLAAIAKLADRACACTDAACRDQVHASSRAERPAETTGADLTKMTRPQIAAKLEHDVAYDEIERRMYRCLEPDHTAPTVLARVTALTDRACACPRSDASCLDAAKADFDRYLEIVWLLQDGYSDRDKQALTYQMRAFETCRQVGAT